VKKEQFYTQDNTDVLHTFVEGQLFISLFSKSNNIGFIESVSKIDTKLLKDCANSIHGEIDIIKIVGAESDFKKIESLLIETCLQLKFVKRETQYELYYKPSTGEIKAAKEEALRVDIEQVKPEIKPEISIAPPNLTNAKVKVLVIDDSKTICNFLKKIISFEEKLAVVGTVNDPLKAEDIIRELKPDVITLDIHMPGMNGVELLKKIQPIFNIPVIMISSISLQEGPLVLEALESGAVDYIQKPEVTNLENISSEINNKILIATKTKQVKKIVHNANIASYAGVSGSKETVDNTLVVIGSSTGGTSALKDILVELPSDIPPILIVQHIPAVFSKAFADRLNMTCKCNIKEAIDGEEIVPGTVYIAPGGFQMKAIFKGDKASISITDDAPVNRFKPSVDYLFNDLAESRCEKNIISIILTGMGRDGAQGTKSLKESKNAITFAQDEETSVVFGMPKETIKLGVVDHIVPLQEIPQRLLDNIK